MQLEKSIIHADSLAGCGPGRYAVGIGVFDGVHRGHQRLLSELAALAARTGAEPLALTFDPHPRSVLHPEEPTLLLIPPAVRAEQLLQAGASRVLVVPFTRELAARSPEAFLERTFGASELAGLCVGSNWRFGAGGRGTIATLAAYAGVRGAELLPVPELELDGAVVSSSRIRRLIGAGRLEAAAALLGRRYRLYGVVERGVHFAGARLGRPTANLALRCGVLPPDGVYAARAVLPDGATYPAAVNLGVAPTFHWAGVGRRLEVHLLDYSGDLYGTPLAVELLRHLRAERSFSGAAELARQIELDIAAIRNLCSREEI